MKSAYSPLLALITSLLLLNSCQSVAPSSGASSNQASSNGASSNEVSPVRASIAKPSASYYYSQTPGAHEHPTLRHYPVGRQGNLTAWLTSNHRMSSGDFLCHPKDAKSRHRIVGRIRASAMKEAAKHDGAFLLTNDYTGPIYPLWEGSEGQGLLYASNRKGWIPVNLKQEPGVNIWVATRSVDPIGAWSSFPLVIGDPANPESIAGAMWYRSNANRHLGGAASPRMLKKWLNRLDFKKFVD